MKYSYKHLCPSCNKRFEEVRKEYYQKYRLEKLCGNCKKKEEEVFDGVVDCGGFRSDQQCGTCVHFTPISDKHGNEWWGKCGKGHEFDTHSPDYFEDEKLGIVYHLDVCADFESDD